MNNGIGKFKEGRKTLKWLHGLDMYFNNDAKQFSFEFINSIASAKRLIQQQFTPVNDALSFKQHT
jgi:hypothetical protein